MPDQSTVHIKSSRTAEHRTEETKWNISREKMYKTYFSVFFLGLLQWSNAALFYFYFFILFSVMLFLYFIYCTDTYIYIYVYRWTYTFFLRFFFSVLLNKPILYFPLGSYDLLQRQIQYTSDIAIEIFLFSFFQYCCVVSVLQHNLAGS